MSRWDTCKKFVSHFSSSVCTVYVWLLETWKIDNLSTILLIWTILLHFFLSFCRQNSLDIHSRLWFSNCRVCTKVLKVLEFSFLKFKHWKPFGNRHFWEEVLEKCLNYWKTIYMKLGLTIWTANGPGPQETLLGQMRELTLSDWSSTTASWKLIIFAGF